MTLGQRLLEQARALDQLRQEHQSCDSKAQQLQERLHQVTTAAPEVFSVPDSVALHHTRVTSWSCRSF